MNRRALTAIVVAPGKRSVANRRVFSTMTAAPVEEALDGIKVDSAGNLFF